MILAIETSTPVCSVALGKDAMSIVEKRMEGKGVHSERTFTFIDELLERHQVRVGDLAVVLFSNGPGSYTGLRIGAAGIKGLLFRQEVPLFTLPTLFGFAVPHLENFPACVHGVIDARREHVYYQKTERLTENNLDITKPEVREITSVEDEIRNNDIIAGTGWNRFSPEKLEGKKCFGTEAVSAKNLILGWNHPLIKPHFKKVDVKLFEPDYLTMAQVNNSRKD